MQPRKTNSEHGITVQENTAQALKWYRKAALQGFSQAQDRIDAMSRRIDKKPSNTISSKQPANMSVVSAVL